ncbi:hypothetical protein OHA74_54400 [Streptomyces phaeochromogenes]|nr:hypothetical protein [Streptomyces phaeochromogenes]
MPHSFGFDHLEMGREFGRSKKAIEKRLTVIDAQGLAADRDRMADF